MKQTYFKLKLILSMLIFSSVGVFIKSIGINSSILAFSRGILGAFFLLFITSLRGNKIKWTEIMDHLQYLIFSGAILGLNWMLLFESYKYTSITNATICYYTAPLIVVLLSPFLFKEKFNIHNLLCAIVAILGIILICEQVKDVNSLKGIFFGLSAACLYAGVIILNKKLITVDALKKTLIQLFSASIVMFIYSLFTISEISSVSTREISFLIIVGVLHTGIAYSLYFNSIEKLPAQTVAIYSYIDPVGAVILSSIVMKEHLSFHQILGTVFVLGSIIVLELHSSKRKLL